MTRALGHIFMTMCTALLACGRASTASSPIGGTSLSVTPTSVGALTGREVSFTISPAASVVWSVDETSSCGTISNVGVYRAPATVPSSGECHVSAVSQADASERAHATITVLADVVGTWAPISPPVDYAYVALSNYGIQGLDGAKADAPKPLYVGTCLYGVWKSTDGGDTWTQTDDPFTGRNWSLVVDPTDSDVVYTLDGFGTSGLWKTTHGGASWVHISTKSLAHIEIDPLDHLHLLMTEHSGNYDLWESLDGGSTWINKGHPWGSQDRK